MRKILLFSALIFTILLTTFSCTQNPTVPVSEQNLKVYIVTLNPEGNSLQSYNVDSQIKELFNKHNIDLSALKCSYDYVLTGFAAKLTEEQVNSLKYDKSVDDIEEDQLITLDDQRLKSKDENFIQAAEVIPWGITSIGGTTPATSNTGVAWVVDTGIDFTHEDLTGLNRTEFSKSFVVSEPDYKDLHGHGTHVSGIIAANDNDIGVVGVCSGATLVAIKVLDKNGSGWVSDIISGLNYVGVNQIPNKLNVVNMSLGGGPSKTLDNAVKNLANKGVYVVIAAGNEAKSAKNYSPARVNATGVFTISAFDENGKFAYFSNYGNPPIDFSAPGVSVYSCVLGNGYEYWSGTSMATPHCVGILLVNNGTINYSGTVTGDKDRNPDKKAHL